MTCADREADDRLTTLLLRRFTSYTRSDVTQTPWMMALVYNTQDFFRYGAGVVVNSLLDFWVGVMGVFA